MAKAQAAPSIEKYLKANLCMHQPVKKLSPAAVKEIQYLADRAEDGEVINFSAFQKWMKEQHGVEGGRGRMFTIVKAHGVKPWWSK